MSARSRWINTGLALGVLALTAGCAISATPLTVQRTDELGYADPARQVAWREPSAERRRAEALAKHAEWPVEVVRQIAAGRVAAGMDRAMVRAARGEPAGYGLNPEQGPTRWVYPGRVFVNFDAMGRVVAVEE